MVWEYRLRCQWLILVIQKSPALGSADTWHDLCIAKVSRQQCFLERHGDRLKTVSFFLACVSDVSVSKTAPVKIRPMILAGIVGMGVGSILADEQPATHERAGAPLPSSVLFADSEVISLFNGRNFDGWVMTDGSPVNDEWEVIDGMIHLKPHTGTRAGSIRTTETFECFELEFEWRVAAGGNSGVKYLASEADSPGGRHFLGCEYQLLDDAGHKNGRIPTKTAGSLYDLYAADPITKQLRPAGEFNHGRIVCHNGRIEHWLNGKKVVEAVVGSDDWEARRRQSKFGEIAGFADGPGVILLQEHLSEAWFRHLRLTRFLTASPSEKRHRKDAQFRDSAGSVP